MVVEGYNPFSWKYHDKAREVVSQYLNDGYELVETMACVVTLARFDHSTELAEIVQVQFFTSEECTVIYVNLEVDTLAEIKKVVARQRKKRARPRGETSKIDHFLT